jgi:hypothetical protein
MLLKRRKDATNTVDRKGSMVTQWSVKRNSRKTDQGRVVRKRDTWSENSRCKCYLALKLQCHSNNQPQKKLSGPGQSF